MALTSNQTHTISLFSQTTIQVYGTLCIVLKPKTKPWASTETLKVCVHLCDTVCACEWVGVGVVWQGPHSHILMTGRGGCISYNQAVPCSFLVTNLFSGFIMCKIIVIKYISMTCNRHSAPTNHQFLVFCNFLQIKWLCQLE